MAVVSGGIKLQKAELVPRIIAVIIDGVIASIGYAVIGGILGMIYGPLALIGCLLAAVFYVLRDSLLDGQSPGKKVMKLQAVDAKTGKKITQEQSIKRNLVGGVGYVNAALAYIPLLGLLSIPISLALLAGGLYELYVWFNNKDTSGRRWGDQLGDTIVVALDPAEAELEEEAV